MARLALTLVMLALIAGPASARVPPEAMGPARQEPSHPTLGVEVRPIWDGFREQSGLPDLGGGVVVLSVPEGTPAARAGIQAGDVIRKFGSTIIESGAHLAELIGQHSAGEGITLEVWREGHPLEMSVELGDMFAMCDSGNAWACGALGDAYASGRGVPMDDARAVALYAKACDGGSVSDCVGLGFLYEMGRGVAKDDAQPQLRTRRRCTRRRATPERRGPARP